jgi:hypothetical protein
MVLRISPIFLLLLFGCSGNRDADLEKPNMFHIEVGSLLLPVDFEGTTITRKEVDGEYLILMDLKECGGTRLTVRREKFAFLSNYLRSGYAEYDQGVFRKSEVEYLTPASLISDQAYSGPLYFVTVEAPELKCAVSSFERAQWEVRSRHGKVRAKRP